MSRLASLSRNGSGPNQGKQDRPFGDSIAAMNRIAIAAAALLAALPAAARPVDAGWPEVARVEDGACTITVTGNGQAYLIAVEGLDPGEVARYRLTNGDMIPIDWSVRADAGGRFARYYMPFRWHRDGGTVNVSLESDSCSVSTGFDWRRATVKVS